MGEIYNIGANNEIRNIDIVKILCKALNKSENLIKYVADRKGLDLRYAICSNKFCDSLGWKAQIDFEKGINNTINWYLSSMRQ